MQSDKKDPPIKVPDNCERRMFALDMKEDLNKKITAMTNKSINGIDRRAASELDTRANENANVDRTRNNKSELSNYSTKKK
jgi:hypothetical protein